MDGLIWMDHDVIIMPAASGGMHLMYKQGDIRMNVFIRTLDDLSDWLYEHGFGTEEEEEDL
jgi:hypothetical protein